MHDDVAHRIACHWANYEGNPGFIRIHWWPNYPTVYLNGEPGKVRANLMADGFAVTFASREELPGYSSHPAVEAERGIPRVSGYLQPVARRLDDAAALDGQPFELTRLAEVVGDGRHAFGSCRLAADLQRAFGLPYICDVGNRVIDFRP